MSGAPVSPVARRGPDFHEFGPMWPSRQHLDEPAIILEDDPATGRRRPAQNPRKEFQKAYWGRVLGPGETFAAVVPALSTLTCGLTANAEENVQGDIEFVKFTSIQDGRFGTEITQGDTDKVFQNSPIPNRCQFGTSQFPGYLYETIYLPATQTLRFKLTDFANSGNNRVQVVGHGRRFLDYGATMERLGEGRRKAAFNRQSHAFWETWDSPNNVGAIQLTALQALAENFMTVPDRADFECWSITDDSDGDYNVQIFEGRSSRALMDAVISCRDHVAAPVRSITGLGGSISAGVSENLLRAASTPYTLPFTHLFKRNTKIRVLTTDTSNATNNVRLVFHGRLIYYPRARVVLS